MATEPSVLRRARRKFDNTLTGLRVPPPPPGGWVRALRDALAMTQAQLGKRLGIERQNVSSLEADERDGTVTLQRLRRAADALSCDLHYVLVPRKPLEQILLDAATEHARQQYGRVARTQALEQAAIDQHELEELVREKAEEIIRERPRDAWNAG